MLESHGSKMWNELAAESLEDTVPIAHCPTCKTPSAQLRDHERLDFLSQLFSRKRSSQQTRNLTDHDWKLFNDEFADKQQMLRVILEGTSAPKPWTGT
jgi:hypothetical protein